jgi:hypothetical protein
MNAMKRVSFHFGFKHVCSELYRLHFSATMNIFKQTSVLMFIFLLACPELTLSFGNVKNCSDDNGDTVCTVLCQPDYIFAPDSLPLKEYRCGQSTGYTWNGQTPACGSKFCIGILEFMKTQVSEVLSPSHTKLATCLQPIYDRCF